MPEEVTDITIVGGGDAGLLTGLCVRQLNPDLDIRVVDDFEAEGPDVGKSTFKLITDILHEFLDVPEHRFVHQVKPVWKASVYFRDWCGRDPFHFPFDHLKTYPGGLTADAFERYYHVYDEVYDTPEFRTNNEEMVAQGKSPYFFTEEGTLDRYRSFAYHLDTDRFNGFLRTLCEERDVDLIDDPIADVDVSDGRVTSVRSAESAYESDLYVDATGFDRVLKSAVGGEFRDFALPLDRAVHATAPLDLSDVVPATVVETGRRGWFWQIDTYDHRDLGYVFSSEHADEATARAEFLDHVGETVDETDVRSYEFTSGYFAEAWTENCVAIGNAEGFVEPLQSTGLTANAQAAVILSILLATHGRVNDAGIRRSYNAAVRRGWESIRDFIAVHYKFSTGSTPFWRDAASIEVSPRVERIVEAYDETGFATEIDPIENDPGVGDLMMFPLVSFFAIMRNLGVESEFYEACDVDVSDAVREDAREFYRAVKSDVDQYLSTDEVYRGLSSVEREHLSRSRQNRLGYGRDIGT